MRANKSGPSQTDMYLIKSPFELYITEPNTTNNPPMIILQRYTAQ